MLAGKNSTAPDFRSSLQKGANGRIGKSMAMEIWASPLTMIVFPGVLSRM
jgi:hypothetical protein